MSRDDVPKWQWAIPARVPDIIEAWSRQAFVTTTVVSGVVVGVLSLVSWWFLLLLPLWVAFLVIGLRDMMQVRSTLRRNYPVLANLRYLAESVRPEVQQYFVESDQDANPFSRENRSIVYQRAKGQIDTLPFGTRQQLYQPGYEWLAHSLAPAHPEEGSDRVTIGAERCKAPYSASLLNISAMSYGSLSRKAVLALNQGARMGNFYHNTGEGGLSPYHLEPGGDVVWQIGTGYFGCRAADGGFDPEKFKTNASRPTVKMIELKLSQGAKPGHGGILPAKKVTAEIAEIRGVPMGRDVNSPPAHTAFEGPDGLLRFVTELRELSGGKPVGFKLCIGHPSEWFCIVKAMLETGLLPDFITVDGGEGGTGAAPLEFSNHVGMPLTDGLTMVNQSLIGVGLRHQLKIISAGKIATGFDVLRQLALGADVTNSARAMMFAIGCIQASKCNTNKCPTGVATQDPELQEGLVIPDKAQRVYEFHKRTVISALELTAAAGLDNPEDLRPHHIFRRISDAEVRHLGEITVVIEKGQLLEGRVPAGWKPFWDDARPDRWVA